MEKVTTDVVIVGAGPAGLSLALCLARHDVRSVVVERRSGENEHPRAHYINTRTMELLRQWGIADRVLADAYPADRMPFGMLEMLGGTTAEERRLMSPMTVASCAQDRVEAALLGRVADYPAAELRWDTTVVDFTDHGDQVVVSAQGPGGQVELTGRWLVGADGSASAVRRQLGIEMIGDPDLGSLVNAYFIGRLQPDGVDAPLAMASPNPDVPGAFIGMDGDRRWCFHHPYDPDVESVADFDAERCEKLIRSAVGLEDDVPIEIRSIRPWTMTALVADRMQQGSVFLVGDAAHAFPPTGGFGMNSGIQDAHNLAWKLASVLSGAAGSSLPDSYEPERQPVAFLNTAQSLRNSGQVAGRTRESSQAELIESRATTSVRSVAALAETEDEREALEMIEHAGAIGQDLGYAYDRSPVIVTDGVERPDIQIGRYVPNACPGARAPHVELRVDDGSTISVLDLFEAGFTLLTFSEPRQWADVATSAGTELGVTVRRVGPGLDLEPAEPGVDVERLYGVRPTGAVLVRPDGFVAWRAVEAPDQPAVVLRSALDTALGRVPVARV
ncbi:MAG: FAD-dependent monooxygenase [Phycicoccus sp.]